MSNEPSLTQVDWTRIPAPEDDGWITMVFYPVFPPDQNADNVLAWLKANPR